MEIIRAARTAADWEHAAALLWDHVDWVRAVAGVDLVTEQPAIAAELRTLREHYRSRDGVLFVAYHGAVAVGTASLHDHPDGTAEIKRMYVRPVARGRGLGGRLLGHVLDAAVAHGRCAVWLETKRGAMDAAIAMYRRNGFVELNERGRTLAVDGIVVMERRLDRQRRCA